MTISKFSPLTFSRNLKTITTSWKVLHTQSLHLHLQFVLTKEKKRKVTMRVWQRRKNPNHLTEKLIKRARKYSFPALCHMWTCSGILAADDKPPFTFSVSFQSVSRDRQAFLFPQGGVDQVPNSYPWQMLNLPALAWQLWCYDGILK